MTFIEAVKSGKNFHRPGYSWFRNLPYMFFNVSREDLLAEDWEVEELKLEITETQFWEAIREGYLAEGVKRTITSLHNVPICIETVAVKLGFKK